MSLMIALTDDPVTYSEGSSQATYGTVKINDFQERFSAPMGYWSRSDYKAQWRKSIEELLNTPGNATSALVVTMHDPRHANFITCWPLYKEGKTVYVHNNLLFLDKLPRPFKIEDVGSYVGRRETVSEDGEKISEWVTDVDDLKECLVRLQSDQD